MKVEVRIRRMINLGIALAFLLAGLLITLYSGMGVIKYQDAEHISMHSQFNK